MTVDSKTILKGRNTPFERTSCTTSKKWRGSLAPEIKFIPVVDVTWAVFLFHFFFSSPFENDGKQADSTSYAVLKLLKCNLRCIYPAEYVKCEEKNIVTLFIVFNSVSHEIVRVLFIWGLLNNQQLHDKPNGDYSRYVLLVSNCFCEESWRLGGRGEGRTVESVIWYLFVFLHTWGWVRK